MSKRKSSGATENSSKSTRTESKSGQSGQRKSCFSNYGPDLAEDVCGTAFDDLFDEQEMDPSKMIKIVEPPPALLDKVFDHLVFGLSYKSFPNCRKSPATEHSKSSTFVEPVLAAVVVQIKKERANVKKLKVFDQHIIDRDENSKFLPDSKGILDFAVLLDKEIGRTRKIYLVVCEVKSSDVDEAVQQCMLYMLRAFELNGGDENQSIYGFCSNAIEWNFIKYHQKKFKLMFRKITMFPGMDKTVPADPNDPTGPQLYVNREHWKQNYSTIVKVLYSCLVDQLDYEKKKADDRAAIEEAEKAASNTSN